LGLDAATSFSGIVALELAQLFGCREIMLVAFDAAYDGGTGYSSVVPQESLSEKHEWAALRHVETMKVYASGSDVSLLCPPDPVCKQWAYGDYTAMSFVNGKVEMAKLRARIAAMDETPMQWIIIDIGDSPLPPWMCVGCDYFVETAANVPDLSILFPNDVRRIQ